MLASFVHHGQVDDWGIPSDRNSVDSLHLESSGGDEVDSPLAESHEVDIFALTALHRVDLQFPFT